jgi:hypothetical protein
MNYPYFINGYQPNLYSQAIVNLITNVAKITII